MSDQKPFTGIETHHLRSLGRQDPYGRNIVEQVGFDPSGGPVCPKEHVIGVAHRVEENTKAFYMECGGEVFAMIEFKINEYDQEKVDIWQALGAKDHNIAYLQGEVVALRAKVFELEAEVETCIEFHNG